MLVDTIEKVKNVSVGYVRSDGLFDSATVNAYTASLRGLSATQAEVVLSSAGLDSAQRKQIISALEATAATRTLTSEEALSAMTRKMGSVEAAKELLIKSELVTTDQLEAGAEFQVSTEKLKSAVSSGILSQSEADNIAVALGLTGTNIGLGTSFKLLTASIWANIKALAVWLVTNPVGWAILAGGALFGLAKITDALTVSVEEQREKLENLKGEYTEIESELKSLNDELTTTQQRMAELEGKGNLTFTEKEEYDNLVKVNNELQRKIDLLELEEKNKRKEKNKAFVSTMEKDTEDPFEHEVDPDGKPTTGQYSIGDEYLTSEIGYIEAQFEIRKQLLDDLSKAETKDEQDRIQGRIDEIDKYLKDKNTQWASDMDGIEYIDNPSTEDEKKVNQWLDFINDFQDRMAIAMGGDNAKTNAFNRVVDNWQFDDTVQGLQDLGKQGRVTAEMLDDSKYDAFIQKLYELGIIDSVDNLDAVALAFNTIGTEAETAGKNVNEMTASLDQLKTASEGISSISSAFKQLSDDGYMSTESISKIQEATKLSGDEWLEYQNKLMNAKAGSAEFNQVMSDLTFRIIDNTFNLEELKDATDEECDAVERQIAAILRENGVTNANAVAQSIVTQAKNGLRSTYESLTYATYEEIDALIDEGISLGYTSGQMFNLIGAHNLLNNSKLNLDDKIAVINRLGDAGLIAASKVSYLIELVNRASGALQATKNPHDLRDGDRQGAAELDLARELGVFSSWKKIDTSKIEVPAFPGVSSGGSSGGGGGSGGGSGSDSNEALDNYLKYVKHKKALGYYDDNTAQYINDLQYALNNLTKTEEEQWDLEEQIYLERENLREEEVSGYESWMSHLESLGYYEDDIAKKINDITWAIENQKLTEEEKFKKEEEIYKLTLDRNEKIRESFENLAKAHSETYNYALSDVERYIEQLEHQKALTDDEALIKSIDKAIINSMADGITKAEEAINNLTIDADYWKSEIEKKLKELGASFDISKWFDYEGSITSQFESDMDVLNNSEAENVISSWANIVSEKLKSVADNTNQIFEYQEKIFSDSKEAIEESISDIKEAAEEIFELRTSKLNSQSTLLKAQHSLINSIAETQHQLDKDILEAETVGARMSEIERESLFTRDEYNKLSGKLNDVLSEANSIQDKFNRKLKGATLDTIDEITSHYERQYELKMKEYEIVKAELDVAKAQQKLENVENEKSVRQWDGEKWIYTSVLQDVIDAQNELADAKYALAQAEIEQSQTEAIQEIDSKVDSLETQKNLFITALEGLTEGTTSARERLNTALNEIADTDVSLFRNIISSVGETLDELGAKISSISIGTPIGSSGEVKVVSGTGNGGIHPVDANLASWGNLKNAYAKGSRHTPKGVGLFDEDNLGSEVLVTKDGVLRQFNAGDTVFNSEMVQRLWDFASGNPIQWNLPNTNAYDISSYINRPEMAQPVYDNRTYFNGVEVNDADGIRIMKEFATYLKSKV